MYKSILAVLALTTASLALPTQNARQVDADVTITLIDATNHQWPVTIPSSQTWTPTNVQESISHVQINNSGNVPCVFFGVDGAVVVTIPGEVKYMDVGPPQTLIGGVCGPFEGH